MSGNLCVSNVSILFRVIATYCEKLQQSPLSGEGLFFFVQRRLKAERRFHYFYGVQFLVIQTAFLGDVILATPVVTELKRIYPDAQIDVLVRKGNEGILANHPAIRETIVFDKKAGKIKGIRQLVKRFRKTKYDEVINLHRFGSSGLITVLSGGRKTTGFDKNPYSVFYTKRFPHNIGDGTHEVERNLSLIAAHGAEKLVRPSVYPSQENEQKVAPYTNEPFVTLAPASVWFTKQLPEEKWSTLAQHLSNNLKVWIVGGPGDRELCERIAHRAGLSSENVLAGNLSLLESCALFAKAERCFVNDSGPLHMASAVNAPTTAFFCSTVPEFGFGPLAEQSTIEQIHYALECRPCGLHGYKACPKGHFKCAHDIRLPL